MEHAIIGTAGHVDHGKTSLIRRLTGIDTDRLPEEQERQLSIDLGFAYFDLPSGVRAGIVDVPGHERFVKNMLAGATGFDLVLLVVAADEGVMPQTVEHRDILSLLGVEHAVVALTKADMVDDDWLDLVEADLAEALQNTPFENAPVVRLSSVTGQGFDELRETIDAVYSRVPPRDTSGPARCWIDRVFSVRGFGTVVTGTLSRGRLSVDDTVELLPDQSALRLRTIQVHGESVRTAAAAQRVALNLSRAEDTGIGRGCLIASPGSMQPTSLLDVRLRLLPDVARPLVGRARVRLHIGTAEILARVILLDCDVLVSGGNCLAQLRLESPTAASVHDRFVIRSYSPMATIGGGRIVDPVPRRHRRHDEATIAHLRVAEEGSPRDIMRQALSDAGRTPMTVDQLARRMQSDQENVRAILAELLDSGHAQRIGNGDTYVHAEHYQALTNSVLTALEEYHAEAHLRPAMPKSRLQAALGPVPAVLLDDIILRLAAQGRISAGPTGLRLATHEVRLTPEHEAEARRLETLARGRGFAPLTRAELLENAGRDAHDLLDLALERGTLVEAGGFLFHEDTVGRAKKLIREHVVREGPFTVGQFRDMVDSSRRFIVPLLEHLDRTGYTRRQGDVRLLAPESDQ